MPNNQNVKVDYSTPPINITPSYDIRMNLSTNKIEFTIDGFSLFELGFEAFLDIAPKVNKMRAVLQKETGWEKINILRVRHTEMPPI